MKQDWHQYEKQLRSTETTVRKTRLTPKNKNCIFEFERHLVVQGIGLARVLKYVDSLKRIGLWLKKDFDTATKEDIIALVAHVEKASYKEWTKQSYKCTIKRFYKWLCKSEDGYPDIVRWINTNIKRTRREPIPRSELLSEEDVQKLLKTTTNSRDKALISTLWESGCRIGEIATLRIKEVQLDDYGVVFQVNGKTGARQIRVINATSHITNWLNNHPCRDNPEAHLWVNIGTRNQHEQMNYRGIRKMLLTLFTRAGMKKKSNPHIFRHSRATFMAGHLTEFQMNQYFGWVQGSDMPSTYVHLSGRDLDNALLRMNGMQKEGEQKTSVLAPQTCPKCSMTNSSDNKFCTRCGGVLSMIELAKLQEEQHKMTEKRHFADNIMNQLMQDPEVLNLLREKLSVTRQV